MQKLHFITFATGNSRVTKKPYSLTQELMINSIQNFTKREVIFHTYDLDKFKSKDWFSEIQFLETYSNLEWKREGYFCAYKALLPWDVFKEMEEGDLLYYADSSAYYIEPFTENIDNFLDIVDSIGHIMGSAGTNTKHNSFNCCDRKEVWDYIWPDHPSDIFKKPHLLASWFALKKNTTSEKFLNEWSSLVFNGTYDGRPLITFQHTVDQCLFNILVYRDKLKTFFNGKIHDYNKNHNNVHRFLNEKIKNGEEIDQYFLDPSTISLL